MCVSCTGYFIRFNPPKFKILINNYRPPKIQSIIHHLVYPSKIVLYFAKGNGNFILWDKEIGIITKINIKYHRREMKKWIKLKYIITFKDECK